MKICNKHLNRRNKSLLDRKKHNKRIENFRKDRKKPMIVDDKIEIPLGNRFL